MNDIKINDIKSLVEIPDFSIYIFSIITILALLIFVSLLYLIYKIVTNRKKDKRKEYYKILEDINFNDSKKAAYEITKYSRLVSSSNREKKLSQELIDELEKYKYKKNVENIDEEIKILFSRFMDAVDV